MFLTSQSRTRSVTCCSLRLLPVLPIALVEVAARHNLSSLVQHNVTKIISLMPVNAVFILICRYVSCASIFMIRWWALRHVSLTQKPRLFDRLPFAILPCWHYFIKVRLIDLTTWVWLEVLAVLPSTTTCDRFKFLNLVSLSLNLANVLLLYNAELAVSIF